jgi:uncharacterized protein YjdB
VQFTATGTFSDNSEQDLTQQASWVSGDPTRVTIFTTGQPGTGIATAVSPGSVDITATVNGISGSARMTVTGGV